jgi:hypothetical protein
MVSLVAAMGHAHRVDAKVRKAAADRSNWQGKLERQGPLAVGCNLLGWSVIGLLLARTVA